MSLIAFLKNFFNGQNKDDAMRILKITGSIEEKSARVFYKINGSTGGYSSSSPFELMQDIRVSGFNAKQSKTIYDLSMALSEQSNLVIKNMIYRRDSVYFIIKNILKNCDKLISLESLIDNEDILMNLSKRDLYKVMVLDKTISVVKKNRTLDKQYLKIVENSNDQN